MKRAIILIIIITIIFGCSNPNRKKEVAKTAAEILGLAADITAFILLGTETNFSQYDPAGNTSTAIGLVTEAVSYEILSADYSPLGNNVQIMNEGLVLPEPELPSPQINSYDPAVFLRNKIEQYTKENDYAEVSDEEYFSDLWPYIQADVLEVYKVNYPDRNPDYYTVRLNTYREKLRENIALVRMDGTDMPEF